MEYCYVLLSIVAHFYIHQQVNAIYFRWRMVLQCLDDEMDIHFRGGLPCRQHHGEPGHICEVGHAVFRLIYVSLIPSAESGDGIDQGAIIINATFIRFLFLINTSDVPGDFHWTFTPPGED